MVYLLAALQHENFDLTPLTLSSFLLVITCNYCCNYLACPENYLCEVFSRVFSFKVGKSVRNVVCKRTASVALQEQ